ncbi:hypothetical protein FRZ61_16710 [Hypericibacter adhaerens]|uniref:Uncharacterized protein n=1 Tax=Hypericibacter adhaerens TaxID=2602016 RepID=A0A5J6MVR8_9PROT|nr:hypothetical protein FRZ61_16710 [Hypericibacter adhaerens]
MHPDPGLAREGCRRSGTISRARQRNNLDRRPRVTPRASHPDDLVVRLDDRATALGDRRPGIAP